MHSRRASALVAIAAIAALGWARREPPRAVTTWSDPVRRAAEVIDSLALQMYDGDGVGGVAVGIIDRDSLAWSRGYGWADAARRIPVTSASVFRIGSITKQFTAVALLQLVSSGRVRLTDPLDRYVPGARAIAGWNELPAPPTLFQLATHTSGLEREPRNTERYASGSVDGWADVLDSALRAGDVRFVDAPGMRYRYSNVGYSLLGRAVSAAAGTSYTQYVEERILAPLQMRHSGFVFADSLGPLARGYVVRAGSIDTLVPLRELSGRGFRVPNGGLFSTVEDMARFVAFELGHGPPGVLPSAQLDTNFRRHVFVNAAMTDAAGLGFVTVRDGLLVFQGHAGDVAGYNAYAVFDRRSGRGMVVLRNASGGRFDSYRLVVAGMRALVSPDRTNSPPGGR